MVSLVRGKWFQVANKMACVQNSIMTQGWMNHTQVVPQEQETWREGDRCLYEVISSI